jgi:hypothetical protein
MLLLAVVVVSPGSAMGLVTEAALWGMSIDPVDLNLFIGAMNGALDYFSTELGATGTIPYLEKFRRTYGITLGEGVDLWVNFSFEFSLFKLETSTAGTLTLENDKSYNISLSVSLQNTRLGLRAILPFFAGLFSVGISGGLSYTSIDYQGAFPLPEEHWTFAFIPPSGAVSCGVGTFYGGLFVRVSLPLLLGFRVYLETGWYWQPVSPFLCEGDSVDLNDDGNDDLLQLSGPWIAGGIALSFGF